MCPEIMSMIKDFSLAIAAITTATVAVFGLKNWSRELKGKANFEVGRALIRATYKLRDELRYARSPWTDAQEFPKDYPTNFNDRTSEIEATAWAYIFQNRWKPLAESMQEFESQALEAEALWGNSIRLKTGELKQCVRNLQVSMESFVSDKANRGEDFQSDAQYAKSVKSDIWADRKDNELSNKISNAILEIEKEIRPHLKRSS